MESNSYLSVLIGNQMNKKYYYLFQDSTPYYIYILLNEIDWNKTTTPAMNPKQSCQQDVKNTS